MKNIFAAVRKISDGGARKHAFDSENKGRLRMKYTMNESGWMIMIMCVKAAWGSLVMVILCHCSRISIALCISWCSASSRE